MQRRLLLAGGMAWASGLLGGCRPSAPRFHATDLGESRISGELPAEIRDFHGRPWKLADFRGKLVIFFFGYTSCPDICPTALAKYTELLRQPGLGPDQVQVVFITLDPERDTPARLADYLRWFDASLLGLHGSPEAIAAVARQFRVTAIRQEVGGGIGYSLDHSSGAYVFDRRGKLRLLIADNAKIADIVADLQQLQQENP
ncbi:SCO family protein [Dechloromonas sp. ZY10]|uniref:SCO family protein n=1 Tax=Dechloromonas aquae TaxID=2664436 RepID=UPI0035281763